MLPSQTPAIRIHSSGPQEQHAAQPNSRSLPSPISSTSSVRSASPIQPMAIPNSRDGVPPPLPPPRHITELHQGKDPGWQWANGVVRSSQAYSGANSSGRYPLHHGAPASSRPETLRSISASPHLHNPFVSRSLPAHSSATQIPSLRQLDPNDDDQSARPNFASRLQSETQLSLRTLHSSAAQFDRQLLSKLGSSSSTLTPPANLSMSLPSPRPSSHSRRSASGLQPLHVPDRQSAGPDSPHARWQGTSPSAMSSGSGQAVRSPPPDQNALNNGLSPRHQRTYYPEIGQENHGPYGMPSRAAEQSMLIDPELHAGEHHLRELNISDRASADEHAAGSRKRRAPSPSMDNTREHRSPGSGNDLYHRRSAQMLNSRLSPSVRTPLPVGSATTIASSLAQSIGSNWAPSMASSATSYASGRGSPGALSPPGEVDPPRLPRLPDLNEHLDAAPGDRSNWRVEKWEGSEQNTLLMNMNAAGLYACECCLKKPRRFRTLVELRNHEAEKQYQCQYCPNRFKNKNEAERHQNSLHLRRNSWSCAALTSGRQAFHPHPVRSDTVDVCGYCGTEFPNPADWRARNEHLVNEHKFGECNQQKKFFRADHFRQHLKHSHGAASGKWTAQLENICIKEEVAPQPLRPTMEVGPARHTAPISSILHENQGGTAQPPSSGSRRQQSRSNAPTR